MHVMRPTTDMILMKSAELWSERSTCSRGQAGVVVASPEGRILTTGYNGASAGLSHCDHTCNCGGISHEQWSSGQLPPMDVTYNHELGVGHRGDCPVVAPCLISVHGEANAIAYAARCGSALGGGRLFTTLSPCVYCAQLIISAGVAEVYYGAAYRDLSGVTLLAAAGLRVVKYQP